MSARPRSAGFQPVNRNESPQSRRIDLSARPAYLPAMGRSKLLRVSLFGLAVFLAAGLIVYLCIPKEPRYQGRTLSQWMADFTATSPSPTPDPKREAAAHAVYQIGTNAIPWLLRWASAKDSKPKAAAIRWINSHSFMH